MNLSRISLMLALLVSVNANANTGISSSLIDSYCKLIASMTYAGIIAPKDMNKGLAFYRRELVALKQSFLRPHTTDEQLQTSVQIQSDILKTRIKSEPFLASWVLSDLRQRLQDIESSVQRRPIQRKNNAAKIGEAILALSTLEGCVK